MRMRSSKPYLIRALYQWIVDSNCTPYILIDANYPAVQAPRQLVNADGSIVFDVSPVATKDFIVGDDGISFLASFSSKIYEIFIPNKAIRSIYAKENEEGMFFDIDDENSSDDQGDRGDEGDLGDRGESGAEDDFHFV